MFRNEDDSWSEPVNLGPVVDQARGEESSPYVSPDGKYFFFMSARQPYPAHAPDRLTRDWLLEFHQGPESGNPAIYWMDAGLHRGPAPARDGFGRLRKARSQSGLRPARLSR